MSKYVDPRFARTDRYRRIIEDIRRQKVCPFCPGTMKHHNRPILTHRGRWFVTTNFMAYPNTRHHLLIIGKSHKERLCELTACDFTEVGWLLRWIEQKFRLRGGAVAMRFGNTRYTGATVCHLHWHIIVPKTRIGAQKQRVAQTVLFPIG